MTFREWLEDFYNDMCQGPRKDESIVAEALAEAIEEFDRRFIIATPEDLAMSTGTIWIEEEQGDECD